MEDKRPNVIWLIAPIALLPVLYVGSYAVDVNPQSSISAITEDGNCISFVPCNYRYGEKWAERIYWPLEQLDRKVFPKRWP